MAKTFLRDAASGQNRIECPIQAPFGVRLRAHAAIARLDHSIKNVFLVPGIVVALSLKHSSIGQWPVLHIAVGIAAATLIACSNYVLNEVLDAPFDRLHPHKCIRPAALGLVKTPLAYVQWLLMMVAGMALASTINLPFFIAAGALWTMGCVYNMQPLRTKDVAYLDVLTESINNPLRMLLGWYMVTATIVPPASMLVAYWMLGCYFMALKRFSGFREIGSRQVANAYRNSFRRYSERALLRTIMVRSPYAPSARWNVSPCGILSRGGSRAS